MGRWAYGHLNGLDHGIALERSFADYEDLVIGWSSCRYLYEYTINTYHHSKRNFGTGP
jgi:hypothetical protein